MPENVTFVAFTATPKAETKTLFGTPTGETDEAGNPIMGSFHLYPMRQAVEEGYIIDPLTGYLPMKTVTKIEGAPADGALVDERAARRRIATWRTLHPTNVMDKAKWIVDHFVDNVAPLLGGQAKAMVVTASRPAVVRYKYAMDAYIASRPELDASEISAKLRFKVPGEPLVAFSDKVSGAKCVMDEDEYLEDNPFALIDRDVSYSEGSLNPRGTGDVADAFDRPENRLLIVADKFQTGFDQKKLVALYVDKKLGNAIEVVQTYSRVNRTYPGKDKVFVVDFANDPEDVLSAFRTYDSGAVMETAQDPDVVYEVKRDLDGDGIYTTAEVEEFRSAFYRSKREAADDDGDGTWRSVLYDAVSDPAHRFADSLRSAQDSHATWSEVARSAAQEGDVAAQAEAEARASAAAERVAELSTFKRRLKKYCSAYNLVSQMVFLDDPALEVFYAFAKLLSHRIEKASPDEVDISGLVLSDYRIVPQKVPASAAGGPLHPMGAGAAAHPPRRETLEKVVERLNSTWGDEGDPLMKARAVNYVADKVATDEVTTTQIANTHNSKEAILSEGRLRNVVIRALMAMMSNELGDLAGRALDDPQAIDPLVDQVYDLIASGRRYDMEELAAFLRDAGERA